MTGLLSTNAFLIIVMLVFIVSGWSQVLLNSCLVFAAHMRRIRIWNYSLSVPKTTSLLLSAVGMWHLKGDNLTQKGNSAKPASSRSSQRSWEPVHQPHWLCRTWPCFPSAVLSVQYISTQIQMVPHTSGSKSFPKGRRNFVLKLGTFDLPGLSSST